MTDDRETLAKKVLEHLTETSAHLERSLADLSAQDQVQKQKMLNARERFEALSKKVDEVSDEFQESRRNGIGRATSLEERATSLERDMKEMKREVKELGKLKQSDAVHESKIGGFDKNWALIFGLLFMVVSTIISIIINYFLGG